MGYPNNNGLEDSQKANEVTLHTAYNLLKHHQSLNPEDAAFNMVDNWIKLITSHSKYDSDNLFLFDSTFDPPPAPLTPMPPTMPPTMPPVVQTDNFSSNDSVLPSESASLVSTNQSIFQAVLDNYTKFTSCYARPAFQKPEMMYDATKKKEVLKWRCRFCPSCYVFNSKSTANIRDNPDNPFCNILHRFII